METSDRKLLNGYHVVFLTQNIIVGVGLLSLPQKISSLGYSETMLPLLFGVIASLTLWPMVWICSQYKNDNLFRMNEILLGKWLGMGMNLFIVIYFTFFLASILSNYMRLIQTTALPEQKITAPIIILLLLLLYIISGGIKLIARFCMMSFFITISMMYFLRWGVEKGDLSHVLPLFNFTGNELLQAMKSGYMAVLGYELIMIYFPYIVNQKKAFKHSLIGIWISIFLYFITTLVSVMYFSEWQLKNVEYSVLHLFKAGEFSFAERIDIFGITLWVFLILSTAAGYLWGAKKGLDSLLSKDKNYHAYIIAIAVFCIIMMPAHQDFKDKLFHDINYISYMMLSWPIILSAVHVLRKKQVQQ